MTTKAPTVLINKVLRSKEKRATTFRNLDVWKLDLWDQVRWAEYDHNLYKKQTNKVLKK